MNAERGGYAPAFPLVETLVGVEPTAGRFADDRPSVGPQRHQYPRLESNQVYDLRSVACEPAHSEDV